MLGTIAWLEIAVAVSLTLVLLAASRLKSAQHEAEDKFRKKKQKSISEVPGPRSFPIIGTSWITGGLFGKYTMDTLHHMYKDLKDQYGLVVKQESYYNWPVISIFGREDIERILTRSTRYPLRPAQDVIVHYRQSRQDRYVNLGLVNEQGPTWQRLRSHLTPELSRVKTVLGFFPALNGVTDDFIDLIRTRRTSNSDGSNVTKFEELAYKMGLESTCMLMLGKHLGFLKPESMDSEGELINTLAEAVRHHFLASRDTFYGFPMWKWFTTSSYKRLTCSEETIYEIISDLIETTLRENELNAKDDDIEAVFLSILRDDFLDIREKKSAIVDFIAAGIHTVGNTLVFLLYTLARNPEVQSRLREEADSLAPPKCDISVDELSKAKYINAFIKEVFRLLPTAPCIARILDDPADLAGDYRLERGSIVLLHTWIAGLDESNFKDAGRCIPERWLEPSEYQPHSPQLVAPFGYGRRSCPGERFVKYALELMVAKIVREFVLEAEGELNLQFEYILAPKAPVTLAFKDRET